MPVLVDGFDVLGNGFFRRRYSKNTRYGNKGSLGPIKAVKGIGGGLLVSFAGS